MKERILFVDDDEAGRALTLFNLTQAGYAVDQAVDGQQAMELFSAQRHQLVVTDLRMPRRSGLALLEHVKQLSADVPVVVITAHGSVETAVQAMRSGAYDFIEKPFGRDVLLLAVARALEHRRLALENRALRIQASGVEREIVAVSSSMRQLLQVADKLAQSDVSILISGESGTGKELVARRIHTRSAVAEGPFVPISCAAMPVELLESELFGHAKGSFTGATRDRLGRFRKAQGGTIFLDEIGEIPLNIQSKLLRVLQEKVVDVVGLDQPVPVSARVVAAANQSLAERVKSGTFREDLYYRLNVVELQVPSLRSRPEDIEPLVRYFIGREALGLELSIPPPLIEVMSRYQWPGNVRELENACRRMAILCSGDTLREADLPPSIIADPAALAADRDWPLALPTDGLSLVDLERRVIEQALRLKHGNVSQAASYLRVPRHVLAYRIEKYGLRRD